MSVPSSIMDVVMRQSIKVISRQVVKSVLGKEVGEYFQGEGRNFEVAGKIDIRARSVQSTLSEVQLAALRELHGKFMQVIHKKRKIGQSFSFPILARGMWCVCECLL